jgi:hypothetical protein
MAEAFAAESAPKPTPSDRAVRLYETLCAKKLREPEPFGENEVDLLEAMVNGIVPVDPDFCERIKLIEITDGLLPLLNQPFIGQLMTPTANFYFDVFVCKLFALRGQLLCHQGNVAAGQAWLLKLRLMARRPGGDQSLNLYGVATAMESLGQETAARFSEIWPVSDRLAYVKSAEALHPMGELHTAMLLDKYAMPGKVGLRTQIVVFKSLSPSQQLENLKKYFDLDSIPANQQAEYMYFARQYQDMISNLTPETFDTLLKDFSDELNPLTVQKFEAFASRGSEAWKQMMAEAAKPDDTAQPRMTGQQKAKFLYRALETGRPKSDARKRLDLELKAKLLIVAMQKGSSFDEKCLVNLTTAEGKALRLGTHEGCKAIVTADGKPFLVIGPGK